MEVAECWRSFSYRRSFLFVLAYRIYGAWISRKLDLNDDHAVPSEFMYDGTDYVPAKTPVLFGHHFSSIAGAGPIVGPILAGLFFGWLPAVIWIILGSIFVGGVHDFGSMVASIRHKARSVAELAKDYMTPLSFRLFLAFIWLAMVYVIVVFMDLTAVSFIDATGCLRGGDGPGDGSGGGQRHLHSSGHPPGGREQPDQDAGLGLHARSSFRPFSSPSGSPPRSTRTGATSRPSSPIPSTCGSSCSWPTAWWHR